MNRSIIICVLMILCWSMSGRISKPVDFPANYEEKEFLPFQCYVVNTHDLGLACLYLSPDHRFEFYGNWDGYWLKREDTLYLYQDWEAIPILDSITQEKDQLPFQKALVPLNGRTWKDLSYPINVSAFLITEDGGLLQSIKDPWSTKAFACSSTKRGRTFIFFYHDSAAWKALDIPWSYNLLPLYFEERGITVPEDYRDSVTWQAVPFDNGSHEFEIIELNRQNGHCVEVDALYNGYKFRIFNPDYFTGSGRMAISYFELTSFSDWMDSINVGDKVELCIFRPNYADSIVEKVKYLQNFPDSIYVMDNEVYGFWFATHKNRMKGGLK